MLVEIRVKVVVEISSRSRVGVGSDGDSDEDEKKEEKIKDSAFTTRSCEPVPARTHNKMWGCIQNLACTKKGMGAPRGRLDRMECQNTR